MLQGLLADEHLLLQPIDLGGLSAQELLDAAPLGLELHGAAAQVVDEPRVAQRERDLVGEGEEQVDVVGGEAGAPEAVVEVERAEHAVRRADRHGDHGAEPHGVHRRVLAEPRIVLGVHGDDGLLRRDGALGDAVAELEVAPADLLAVDVARDGHAQLAAGLLEQHEAAFGGREVDRGVHGHGEDVGDLDGGVELAEHREEPLELGGAFGGGLRLGAGGRPGRRCGVGRGGPSG
ncbi:hypothetical protein BE20_11560, partial [Sorangium cellulosum]